MTIQKVYVGSVGPFLYDDTDPINDADGDFASEDCNAISSNGQLLVEGTPTNPNHAVRLQDLSNMLTPTFADVTASRALNTVYQNGDYLTFAQISLELPADSGVSFLTDAATPPTVITAIATNSIGGVTIKLTLSVIILPNHYFELQDSSATVTILNWIEYQMGV